MALKHFFSNGKPNTHPVSTTSTPQGSIGQSVPGSRASVPQYLAGHSRLQTLCTGRIFCNNEPNIQKLERRAAIDKKLT